MTNAKRTRRPATPAEIEQLGFAVLGPASKARRDLAPLAATLNNDAKRGIEQDH